VDAHEENRNVSDQQKEDDESKGLVMTICLMPLECSALPNQSEQAFRNFETIKSRHSLIFNK